MQCIRCGAEINEGMAFCPTCGTAQNVGNEGFENNQQPQQQWQPQPQFQDQAHNNKNSKTPLIISLVVAIIIIIGLAVTCIVLVTSKNSSSKNGTIASNKGTFSKASTAEYTVNGFLEALVEGDYSEAFEYVLPGDVDYFTFGDVDLSKSSLKRNYQNLTGYEIDEKENLKKSELYQINDYLDYSEEITDAVIIEVEFIYDYYDDDDAAVYVVKTSGRWYILAIDN